jgi:integrase/recombinase XerD
MRDFNRLEFFSVDIKKPLSKLKLIDFQLFLKELNEISIAPTTQARILSGIKSFYKFLLLEEIIDEDPTDLLESPRLGRKLPEVLSLEEIDLIIAAIDLSKPEGQRNNAIIETLYSCGLRVSELIDLKISNLFKEDGFIRIIGKGNKERLVPIGQKALNEIDLYMTTDRLQLDIQPGNHDFVFLNRRGKKLTRVMIFTIVKNHTILAGIKKDVSPHTFRHSFATHLLEGGANLRVIQQMLGHASILTTEIYTHLDNQMLRDTVNMFHPRANK